MIKPIIMLTLLAVIPGGSDKPKPLTKQEVIQLRSNVEDLEELVVEQQQRLQVHKSESDKLAARVNSLESRLAALEEAIARQDSMPTASGGNN